MNFQDFEIKLNVFDNVFYNLRKKVPPYALPPQKKINEGG